MALLEPPTYLRTRGTDCFTQLIYDHVCVWDSDAFGPLVARGPTANYKTVFSISLYRLQA